MNPAQRTTQGFPVADHPMPPPGPPPEGDDEGRRLAEAKQIVKQEAFRMKRALDQRNLRDALKHA